MFIEVLFIIVKMGSNQRRLSVGEWKYVNCAISIQWDIIQHYK